MRTRALIATAALAAATLAACGGGGDDDQATTTSTARRTTSTSSGPAHPLTGRPGTAPDRPALVVKIDNAPKARPQLGINQADLVVEEAVEGGVTRLFTVFHSQDPGEIGPIRSARSTDVGLAAPLNRPLFAYSGANTTFLKLVREAPLVDIGYDAKPSLYRRERGRPAPYNLFSTSAQLWSVAGPERPEPLFRYGPAAPGAAPSTGAHLEFRGRVRTIVDYEWRDGGWARTQDGTPHVDGAGAQVAPANVVIQVVEYRDTGIRDQSREPVPEAVLTGEGDAWVLRDGTAVKGRWKRASEEAATTFETAGGEPLTLTPGQTWLELARTDANGIVSVR